METRYPDDADCEGICGSGHLLEFRRRDGRWIFDKAVTVWIS